MYVLKYELISVNRYTNCKTDLLSNFNVPLVDAPELNIPGEEVETLTYAWFNVRIIFFIY